MQRQGLNIEEVDHDQHCEQDQLAPLRGVTEEELDVFQDELALGDGEPAEQRAHRPAPEPTTNEALCPLLRRSKPLCVPGAVQHSAEGDECGSGRPQEHEGQGIEPTLQISHAGLRRPLTRQERRCRAAQENEEVEQIAKSFGPSELFGSNDPEEEDHATRGAQRDDRQQIARATRWKDVYQHQRDRAAQHRRENQHRDDGENRVDGEQHATLVYDAVGRQDRHDHQRHHPRRMQQRLTQLGEIQPQPVHRRRDEQVEVLGEEEARERRDDVRQHQDGYEGKQNEPEDLARDERSQLFDSAEIAQDEKQHAEDACPERPSDNDQNDELAAAALGALFTQPLQRGPPFGLPHVGERRLLDHVPPNTSTRSRTWAPPVSLRNSSSRLASPAWCWRRTSLTVPAATVLPCWMIAIWSHIASATSSVCVLMSTVPPRSTNCRKMSLRSRAALGSRPTIGSSTTMHSGR